jgi:hypothetical protein
MSKQASAPTEQVSVVVSANAFGTLGKVPKEAELDWFFSTGQSLFEASTFGALLERQSQFGQTFDTCESCAGSGFDEADNSCPKCRGMGGRPVANGEKPLQQGLLFSTTRCDACALQPRARWSCSACDGYGRLAASGACCVACKSSGFRLKKNGQARRRPPRRPRPAVCWCCRGKLYLERSPVGLKAEVHDEPSYTPDDVALQRFAQVSRYLMRCQSDSVDVLAAFFGLSGYRWANTKWGRLFSLVPYTNAGEARLKRQGNPLGLGDHKLLENLVQSLEKLQDKDHKAQAETWLELVTQQAAELFTAAADDWRSVVDPKPVLRLVEATN